MIHTGVSSVVAVQSRSARQLDVRESWLDLVGFAVAPPQLPVPLHCVLSRPKGRRPPWREKFVTLGTWEVFYRNGQTNTHREMQRHCSDVAKRRNSRDDDSNCARPKRVRHIKQVALPSQLDIHSAFRLFCISKPNEHSFNVLLEGALRCYCVGTLERAKSLVYVRFDTQFFGETPERAVELVDASLFDEFCKLYKDTAKPVPLHGLAFRGYDLCVPYQWLVTKVIDGRIDPMALIWEASLAGLTLPVDTQLRWAVERSYQAGVMDMCF